MIMKTIRNDVFETNSSSTHSICICTDEELSRWVNKEVVYNDDEFTPIEIVLAELRKEFPEDTDKELLEIIEANPWNYGFSYENWGK